MAGWLSRRSRPVSDWNLTVWCHTSATEPGDAGAIEAGLGVSPPVAGVLAGVLTRVLVVGDPLAEDPPDPPPDPPLAATTPMTAARIVAPAPISATVIVVVRVDFE